MDKQALFGMCFGLLALGSLGGCGGEVATDAEGNVATESLPSEGGCTYVTWPNVNQDSIVDSRDALVIQRYLAGLPVSYPVGRYYQFTYQTRLYCGTIGDVDCDRRVTSADALRILRHVAGLLPGLTYPGSIGMCP